MLLQVHYGLQYATNENQPGSPPCATARARSVRVLRTGGVATGCVEDQAEWPQLKVPQCTHEKWPQTKLP